jgi:hypothetical protein
MPEVPTGAAVPDALTRWIDRCVHALETGEGLPTQGLFWWKRPDECVVRAICSSLRLLERYRGNDGEWIQLQLLEDQAWSLAMRAPRNARGYALARAWLREELERDGGDHG